MYFRMESSNGGMATQSNKAMFSSQSNKTLVPIKKGEQDPKGKRSVGHMGERGKKKPTERMRPWRPSQEVRENQCRWGVHKVLG